VFERWKIKFKNIHFFSSPIFYRRFLWRQTIFAEFNGPVRPDGTGVQCDINR
jgi:hypothetical protein